jgi:hypothetical protein
MRGEYKKRSNLWIAALLSFVLGALITVGALYVYNEFFGGANDEDDSSSGRSQVEVITTSFGISEHGLYAGAMIGTWGGSDGVCIYRLHGPRNILIEEELSLNTSGMVSHCNSLLVARDRIEAGQWRITISYRSDSYEGESVESTIDIVENTVDEE